MPKKPLPSASDYPPLEQWLVEHSAREAWRAVAAQGAAVACYVIGTSTALALLRPDGKGWELYTALDTIDIPESLADAHRRVAGTEADHIEHGGRALMDALAERDAARAETVKAWEKLGEDVETVTALRAALEAERARVANLEAELLETRAARERQIQATADAMVPSVPVGGPVRGSR